MAWTPASAGTNLLIWPRADAVSASPVTSLVDKTGVYTLAPPGNAPTWSATGAAGQADILFARASSQALKTGVNVTAGIGTGDFAIGVVCRFGEVSVTQILTLMGTGLSVFEFGINSGKFAIYYNGFKSFSTVPASGTWYSLLVQRVSGTVQLWVNGAMDATTYAIANSISDNHLYMGYDGANYVDGEIPDLAFFKQSFADPVSTWFSYTTSRYGIAGGLTTYTGSAALAAVGLLSPSSRVSVGLGAALAGAGLLLAPGVRVGVSGWALFTGAGAVNPVEVAVIFGSQAFAGVASLAPLGRGVYAGSVEIDGVGVLTGLFVRQDHTLLYTGPIRQSTGGDGINLTTFDDGIRLKTWGQ